ncbi:hypothetical protein STEG23_013199, partial [Scotinomys teguina]
CLPQYLALGLFLFIRPFNNLCYTYLINKTSYLSILEEINEYGENIRILSHKEYCGILNSFESLARFNSAAVRAQQNPMCQIHGNGKVFIGKAQEWTTLSLVQV